MGEPAVHVIVPDTQVKPGVPLDHLDWIGRFLVEEFAGHPNLTWIHLGDHWDMPSLSSYDRGKKSMEGRRYVEDIAAGNEGFRVLNQALVDYNDRRTRTKHRRWLPQRVFLQGNHEWRIARAAESDAQLDGLVTLSDCDTLGWETVEFLTPRFIDGVGYAHYFQNPMTGKPLGGVASTRIKAIGHSFTMGHQQVLDYTMRYVRDEGGVARAQHGLIAGACYLHDEDYKGVQGNAHWRGIVVKRNVRHGDYDPSFISLDALARRFSS